MNEARQTRLLEVSARKVGAALLTPAPEQALQGSSDLTHLRSRLSALHVLLDGGIARFEAGRAPAAALALILTADFCWQAMRKLANRSGGDQAWIAAALPEDWQASDEDIGDNFHGRQRCIVENAKWVFDLHSSVRHPASMNRDLIALLRNPVEQAAGDRLLLAAREIKQVWICVQARIDPTVSL